MATYNYMMCKEASISWLTRIGAWGAKAKALPGAQTAGKVIKGTGRAAGMVAPWIGLDKFNKWMESNAEEEARKNAEAAYAKFLPINREKLRRENIKNILMYTGASAAGASAGYYLSEKNKRRNALLGAVIAPTALHVARSAYNSMNISPEAYTRQQVGLS